MRNNSTRQIHIASLNFDYVKVLDTADGQTL